MLRINDYLLQAKRKAFKLAIIWCSVLVFIMCSLIIISVNVRYYSYYQNTAIVQNGIIRINVRVEDLDKVLRNNELVISDKKYKYQVIKLSSEFEEMGLYLYKEVNIDVKLDKNIKIDNNILKVMIITDKSTIFRYIFSFIRG